MRVVWLLSLLVAVVGCNTSESPPPDAAAQTDAAKPASPAQAVAKAADPQQAPEMTGDSGPVAPPTSPPTTQTPGTAPSGGPATPQGNVAQGGLPLSLNPPANAPPTGNQVPAQVGVGKRGRSLDNETGVLVQPAKSLFAFAERAVFEIQIPQALKLFEATEGRKPNSDEEFMSRIIRANNIRLPELPDGQTYRYDPQRGELMVMQKAN
jgi:hypothetical protein